MREKKNYAERTVLYANAEPRRKYFLIYEGDKTEGIYFEAVNDLRNEIGIDPLIQLVPLMRDYSETGWSNPRKTVKHVMQNLKEFESGEISYQSILDGIMEFLIDQKFLQKNSLSQASMWEALRSSLQKSLSKQPDLDEVIPESELEQTVGRIVNNVMHDNVSIRAMVETVPKIIREKAFYFMEEDDKICFIFDRDKESFLTEQYDEVRSICEKNGFILCISNPCFEFWLLLHFEDILGLEETELLENKKISNKHNFVTNALQKRLKGYQKYRYDAFELVRNRLDIALENEKKFCEDLEGLEKKLGSNVGLLIASMRKTS